MRIYSRDGRLMSQYGEQKRTPAKLEEWLFDQDAIAEVYADSDALWQSLRDQAREAKAVTHRRV